MLKLLNFSCSRCSFPSDHSDHFLVNINSEALAAAGKSACKANAAVARELACWVWEIGCRSEGTVL